MRKYNLMVLLIILSELHIGLVEGQMCTVGASIVEY